MSAALLSRFKSALMLAYRWGLPFNVTRRVVDWMRRNFPRWPGA